MVFFLAPVAPHSMGFNPGFGLSSGRMGKPGLTFLSGANVDMVFPALLILVALQGVPLASGTTLGTRIVRWYPHGRIWKSRMRGVLSLIVNGTAGLGALLLVDYFLMDSHPFVFLVPDLFYYNPSLEPWGAALVLPAFLNVAPTIGGQRSVIENLSGVDLRSKPMPTPKKKPRDNWQPVTPDDPLAGLTGGGVAPPLPPLEEPPESHVYRIDDP